MEDWFPHAPWDVEKALPGIAFRDAEGIRRDPKLEPSPVIYLGSFCRVCMCVWCMHSGGGMRVPWHTRVEVRGQLWRVLSTVLPSDQTED